MFDPLSNFKLNKILSAVNALPTTLASSFTEVKNAIAGVQNTTNSINGTVGSINTNVNTLVAGRVVKSVQRGELQLNFSNTTVNTVNLSQVNLSKSVLIFSSNAFDGSGYNMTPVNIMGTLYSNYIAFYGLDRTTKGITGKVSWQVIEYY